MASASELPKASTDRRHRLQTGRSCLESKRPLADVKTLAEWALGALGSTSPDLDVRRPSRSRTSIWS